MDYFIGFFTAEINYMQNNSQKSYTNITPWEKVHQVYKKIEVYNTERHSLLHEVFPVNLCIHLMIVP